MASAQSAARGAGSVASQDAELAQKILDLVLPDKREAALLHLSKNREVFPDLAPMLWWSVGTMSALLQEIVAIYPALSPPTLTPPVSNRVCNALALLQCVASHPDTRRNFLEANIALYLYPFLSTAVAAKPFEYLRLTSLGVIGALVKHDDPDVVNFLIRTEIIPHCLQIMQSGTELSKTVAVFILEKIIMDKNGLMYVCATSERFYLVAKALKKMVGTTATSKVSPRLLKHVIRCFLRLAEHSKACDALKDLLPRSFTDGTFAALVHSDQAASKWLQNLVERVS